MHHAALCVSIILLAPDRQTAAPTPTLQSLRQEAAALLAPYTDAAGADTEATLRAVRDAIRTIESELEDEESQTSVLYEGLIFGATVWQNAEPDARLRSEQATRTAIRWASDTGLLRRLESLSTPIMPPTRPLGSIGDRGAARESSRHAGATRRAALLLAAHNAESLRAGDRDAFVRGTRTLATLARVVSITAVQIDRLAAGAIEQLMLAQVRSAVASRLLDDASLRELDAILAEPACISPAVAMRGESLATLVLTIEMAELAAQEANEDHDTPVNLTPGRRMLPTGLSLDAQVSLTRRAFAEWAELIDTPPGARAARRTEQAEMWNAVIANAMLGSMFRVCERLTETADMMEATRRGTRILLALERHRLATNTHPETLDALVPDYLSNPIPDPYTGQPFGYLGPAKGPHPGGRPFVLYAAGSDLTDDGGVADFTNRYNPDRSKSGGQDMPINVETPE
ncbi:MAG: hypothetical protein KF705_03200 [Phycisphaeraceae bacterium]|nr:hypothetical protein [Phycisphaeraceae bacterium]